MLAHGLPVQRIGATGKFYGKERRKGLLTGEKEFFLRYLCLLLFKSYANRRLLQCLEAEVLELDEHGRAMVQLEREDAGLGGL